MDVQSLSGLASAAMVHLGRDPIADLAAENDQMGATVRERYPALRDALLRAYPWNFATHFAALPGSKLDTPMFGFTHKCTLPSGGAQPYCLRLWRLENPHIKYTVQGRNLFLKSAPPVVIEYTARMTDVEQFDPLFYELLALDLALALVNRVASGDVRRTRQELRALRRDARRKAGLADAMEGGPRESPRGDQGSWLASRRPA